MTRWWSIIQNLVDGCGPVVEHLTPDQAMPGSDSPRTLFWIFKSLLNKFIIITIVSEIHSHDNLMTPIDSDTSPFFLLRLPCDGWATREEADSVCLTPQWWEPAASFLRACYLLLVVGDGGRAGGRKTGRVSTPQGEWQAQQLPKVLPVPTANPGHDNVLCQGHSLWDEVYGEEKCQWF